MTRKASRAVATVDRSNEIPAHPLAVAIPTKHRTATVAGVEYEVAKVVTRPLLKHAEGQTVFIKIEGEIYVGKEITTGKDGEAKQKPADLCTVVDLTTGEEMDYIVSAIAKSNLNETYPKGAYVGKSFAIHKGPKVEGKRYKAISVVEIRQRKAA